MASVPELCVEPEFSRPVNVERLPAGGRWFVLSASAEECQALAARFGLVTLSSFEARIHLKAVASGDVIRAEGELAAEIIQVCGVSLQKFATSLTERFSLSYAFSPDGADSTEIAFDPEGEDPPEPIVNGMIDLGEISAEYLGLSINPFARSEGALLAVPPGVSVNEPERESPFSALGKLRKD